MLNIIAKTFACHASEKKTSTIFSIFSINFFFMVLILHSKQIIGGTTAHFANYYYPFRNNPFGCPVAKICHIYLLCAFACALK